jgi:DNA-binding protein H-NS
MRYPERKMPKTLAQLKEQLEELKRQTEEVEGVIARIKEAIRHYGLTVEDLFGAGDRGSTAKRATKTGKGSKRAAKGARKKPARKTAGVIRFRDEAGNSWTGNGKRPKWYLDALASGKTPEDLAVR